MSSVGGFNCRVFCLLNFLLLESIKSNQSLLCLILLWIFNASYIFFSVLFRADTLEVLDGDLE